MLPMCLACKDWSAMIKIAKALLNSTRAHGVVFIIIFSCILYLRDSLRSIDNGDAFACLVSVSDIKTVQVYNPNGVPSVEISFRILKSASPAGKWRADGRAFKLYYTIGNAREGLYYSVLSMDEFGLFIYPVIQANSSGDWRDGEKELWNLGAPSADLILSRWRWHASR